MKVARLVGAAVLALFLFLFIGIDLVLFGVIPLNSAMVTILPLIGVLLVALLGIAAGVKAKGRQQQQLPPPMAEPQPPSMA